MRWRRPILLLVASVAFGAPGVAPAQTVVTSDKAEKLGVTIYRAEDRDADDAMDLDWLEGYALITETRTVTIPAGAAVIRFEGVAGGMLPESALVTGLPASVREKNFDADLLSPRSLYARMLGRPVTLRRTNRETGEVREERAIIRSGEDGAAILQTKAGFEAANCGPLEDSILYDQVPAGLSARPTLSIATESPTPATVTLTLSYLAWGFDWQTNYVVHMLPDGHHADITAWVTLANSDPTSFPDAEMAVVAGKLNREDDRGYDGRGSQWLQMRCFARPMYPAAPAPPPPPAPMEAMVSEGLDEIVVTAQRRAPLQMAREALGDLKLYRMPVPTNVASNAQKQVAMYVKPNVRVTPLYTARFWAGDDGDIGISRILRTRNRTEEGLGVPLPAGPVAVFEPLAGTEALSDEAGGLADKAVGEEVEIELGETDQLSAVNERRGEGDDWEDYEVTVTNANPWPALFEARLEFDETEYRLQRVSAKLGRKNGEPLWAVKVPANGKATLRYRLKERD